MGRISRMDDVEKASVKYLVAVASTDGETVNRHYGKSEIFYIYSVDDEEGYEFLEKRLVKAICQDGKHNIAEMEKHVLNFKDCKYVLASRIGSAAIQTLSAAGITAMELPGSIDEAMLRVWKYNRMQGLFN